MKKIVSILFLLFSFSAYSQTLSVFNIDTTSFPIIKASFFALDANGNQIKNLASSNFEVKENNQPRQVTSVTCPVSKPQIQISSVLTIDASGSMAGINLNMAKEAAKTWINTISLVKNECAVTSFDNINYINQDFTTDRNLLLNAVNKLIPNGGTDFDYGLLNPLGGSLVISKAGKHKKIIVFITDGCPNNEPQVDKIIAEAASQNCIIYSVVVGNDCPKSLKEISIQTGGLWFENITTTADAKKVYQQILITAQGGEPCSLEWQSGVNCQDTLINIDIKIQSLKLSSFASYKSPYSSLTKLEFLPPSVTFKNAVPGKKVETTVKVTAQNADFNITKIISSNSSFSIDKTKFLLNKGQSINLIVSFNPIDSGYVYSKFSFETNTCPMNFYASGGFIGKKPNINTLKLLNPNGGETYAAGSDTLITWEGISETDSVKLEYSIDDGNNWKTIQTNAAGLKYIWKNIPKPESKLCKVRIKQNSSNNTTDKPGFVQYSLNSHSDGINVAKWNSDGSRIATASLDSTIIIWDAANGTKLNTLIGHNSNVNNLCWSPDGSRIVSAGWDSTVIIWDAASGEKIHTLTGHSDIVWDVSWSPDGSRIASAGFDNSAIIWNANSGLIIDTLSGHTSWVSNVSWSPDGNYLATSSNDKTSIIWDMKKGTKLNVLKGHTGWVSNVSWSPDGNYLATSSNDKTSRIWDIKSGTKLLELLGHSANVNNISWSPDGNYVATSSDDNTSIIWNAKDGSIVHVLEGLTFFVNHVHWNPDGSRIAAASDNSALIWDAKTGTKIYNLSGHTNTVTDVNWSLDGSRLVTSSLDNSAKIWFVGESIKIELQQDESDSLFSIVEPKAKTSDIDMGLCLVGKSKDSLITEFLTNVGTTKFRVDSIFFSGIDASSFKLVSGLPKYELAQGAVKSSELKFTPKRIGIHSATINIIIQSDTIKQNIQGEGTQIQIEINSQVLDFGKVKVGSEKIIQDTILIKNISDTPIIINDVVQLGPDLTQFEIIKGGGSFTIEPFKSQKLTLKFKPNAAGRTSGRIGFEFNGIGSPAVVQLFGEGVRIIPQMSTNSPICEGDDLLLFARTITNAQYNWFGPDGFKSNLQNPVIKNVKPYQSGKYYLFASFGNISSDTVFSDIVINSNLITPGDSSLIFVGSAAKEDDYIKLTNPVSWDGGSIWLKNRFSVKQDFSTTFKFRIRYGDDRGFGDGSEPGADGFAFVMQNHNYPFLGIKGGSMGYTGITNSLAIEFDLYQNSWDPNGNHIAVQSMGSQPNQPDHTIKTSCLGINDKIISIKQDTLYYAKIEYNWASKLLKIYLDTTDNLKTPVLTIPNINLATYLQLEEGEYVYIGFTAGTGEAYQEHDIFDWTIPCKNQLVNINQTESEKNKSDILILYPNPANDAAIIQCNLAADSFFNLEIVNTYGIEIIKPILMYSNSGNFKYEFETSTLSEGVYFVILRVGSQNYIKKLIITR